MASEPTPDTEPNEGDRLTRASITWPTPRQTARQLGAVTAIVVLWAGLFWGTTKLPTAAEVEMASGASARREARRQQADTTTVPAAEIVADTQPPRSETSGSPAAVPAATPSVGTPGEATGPSAQPTATVTAPARQAAPPPSAEPAPPKATATAPAEADDDPLAELMEDAASLGDVSFAADVMPVLERRCVKCHGGEREEGGQRIEEGLSLLTWEDVMAGSTWGSVVEPGDAAGSYLLELIQNGDMPDKEPRLLPREVRVITQWIATGAKKN